MPWYYTPNYHWFTPCFTLGTLQSEWYAFLGLFHSRTRLDVGKTVKVNSSENNTYFTLSTAQDFRCWPHWNWPLALARVTKGALHESRCTHLILHRVGKLCFYLFWMQPRFVPRHPFQTASFSIDVYSCWMGSVLCGGICWHYPSYRG